MQEGVKKTYSFLLLSWPPYYKESIKAGNKNSKFFLILLDSWLPHEDFVPY
jgi:hypothetical protein